MEISYTIDLIRKVDQASDHASFSNFLIFHTLMITKSKNSRRDSCGGGGKRKSGVIRIGEPGITDRYYIELKQIGPQLRCNYHASRQYPEYWL